MLLLWCFLLACFPILKKLKHLQNTFSFTRKALLFLIITKTTIRRTNPLKPIRYWAGLGCDDILVKFNLVLFDHLRHRFPRHVIVSLGGQWFPKAVRLREIHFCPLEVYKISSLASNSIWPQMWQCLKGRSVMYLRPLKTPILLSSPQKVKISSGISTSRSGLLPKVGLEFSTSRCTQI